MERKINSEELFALLGRDALLESAAEKIKLATESVLADERIRILEDFCKSAWRAKAMPFIIANSSRSHFKLMRPVLVLSEPVFKGARICFFEQSFGVPEKSRGACSRFWLVKHPVAGAAPRPEEPVLALSEEVWAPIAEYIRKEYKERENCLLLEPCPGIFLVRIVNTYEDGSRGDWLLVVEAENSGKAVRFGLTHEKIFSPKSRLAKVVVFENGTWRKVVFSDEDTPLLSSIEPKQVEFSIL